MFRRRRPLDDFAAEIESHLQIEIDRLQEEGLSPEEARAAAKRAFGNVATSRERFYEAHRWMWRERLSQDVRYASRMLLKSPAFATTAILTLALGIGATTAVFSVFDATILHPLPYPQADRLVSVQADLPGAGSYDIGMSQPEWRDLERSGIFEQISPSWFDENNLTGASRPIRIRQTSVAPNYFALLGVEPQLGRTFPPGDRSPSFTLEVVISDGMWKREFGADPHILGRNVRIDTDLYHIVGVMPAGFHPPGRTPDERNVDAWAATSFYGAPMFDHPPRNGRNLPVTIGRIKSGLTLAEAQQRIDALATTLRAQYPADYPPTGAWALRLVPLKDTIFGNVQQSLTLLLAAVGLVLLLVCVNVANLLLARASARGREFALRQALGAGRGRLVRQLLTESALLSVVGGGAAVAILGATKGLLVDLVPDTLPRLNDIAISWSVLTFAFVATTISAVVFGLAPAVHASHADVMTVLKSETRASTGSRGSARARRVLVVAEFALSLVLMVAAGLLLRSFWDLLHVGLGFTTERVMTIRTRLPYPNDVTIDKYPTSVQQAPFFREVVRRIGKLPGVEDVALASSTAIPLDHAQRDTNTVLLLVEGRGTDPTQAPVVEGSVVTPEYFDLLRLTLERGRLFTTIDSETQPAVAVINDAMARTFWPNEDPIGQRVKLRRRATAWTTIVGVIANARTDSLDQAGVPMIYENAYQSTTKHLAILIRGHLDIAATADRVRGEIQRIDDALPVFGARALGDTVSASLAARRFSMNIVGLFALTALVLAGLGIYGVMSYTVTERTREIGIRLALGAEPRAITRLVVRDGLQMAAAGAAIGWFGAAFVSRAMAGLLFGVHPDDPATFAGVTLVLALVALVACYLPARRAVRLEPSRIL